MMLKGTEKAEKNLFAPFTSTSSAAATAPLQMATNANPIVPSLQSSVGASAAVPAPSLTTISAPPQSDFALNAVKSVAQTGRPLAELPMTHKSLSSDVGKQSSAPSPNLGRQGLLLLEILKMCNKGTLVLLLVMNAVIIKKRMGLPSKDTVS